MKVPKLVVFDLDDCVWSPEMYTLSQVPGPSDVVKGDLNGKGQGVIGVKSGGETISMFDGALEAFQRLLSGEYGKEIKVAAASSADTPKAVQIGKAAMGLLEIVPGVTLREAFGKIGGGFGDDRNLQIGRSPPLSSNKAATHFPILKKGTGISFEDMLFFDDCNWTDHCTAVGKLGVTTQRTPHGMKFSEFEKGMKAWSQRA